MNIDISVLLAEVAFREKSREIIFKLNSLLNLKEIAIGCTLFGISNFVFDYILYAMAIKYLGLLVGGGVMMLASATICFGMILAYRASKKDWLGIDAVREIKDQFLNNGKKGKLGRLVAWLWRKGIFVEFIILSLKFDPFVTTEYLKGAHGETRLDRRDWCIFMASILVANVYWALVVFAGVTVFESVNLTFPQDLILWIILLSNAILYSVV